MHILSIIILPLLASVQATYTGPKIRWGPCNTTEFSTTLKILCGTLSVPLDYTDKSFGETLELQLLKLPALIQPSKGSILHNFGGPGEEARHTMILPSIGPVLQGLSGGIHDLITFDPRGTATTLPMDCQFDPTEQLEMFAADIKWPRNTSDPQTASHWAQAGSLANICAERANVTGSLISSAFTARDFISVVDALEEDGMLRYWGFSYGTTLGATIASMFPERIDKMILDGVQNPHEYSRALADFEEWTDTEKLFSQIFEGCVESPATCRLARRNQTAAQLEQAVWDLIDDLYLRPVTIGNYLIDYTAFLNVISSAMYSPSAFPFLAAFFDHLLDGDTSSTEMITLRDELIRTTFPKVSSSIVTGQALVGIHCGDNNARVTTLEDFLPAAEELHRKSRIMGPTASLNSKTCPQWKIRPRERYDGNFTAKTKNPMLIVGNTWDPVTPLVSAKNVSTGFEGSVVLEVRGWGHSSLPNPSLCSLKTMSSYWANGTLPEVGRVCEVDAKLYSNVSWLDVFTAAGIVGSNSTSSGVNRRAYNVRL